MLRLSRHVASAIGRRMRSRTRTRCCARWRLESDRIAGMKSELETLSARLRALHDGAHEESERRTAFRLDMSSSARSCRIMRRSTRASRERLAASAESLMRIHQNRT